jgi:tRNA-uridine 2-sulfurtransferase
MSRRAIVAMSGGVDSSVAAALLVEQGYDVTGVMLKLWRGDEINNASGCCNIGAAEDARRVADVLGIPFYVFNMSVKFEATVIRNFKDEYISGRTPNPCVRCNQWIKFDALFERARALGADVLATGHYVRLRRTTAGDRIRVLRGADQAKDQSYVLWMLSQSQLAHCRFPVGDLQKSATRRIASELGLRTASKPDSQEICFVRGGDLDAYATEHLDGAGVPGPLLDVSGSVVGEHRGIAHYTIGQRKGLGISLGVPVYVTSIDAATNSVVVGERSDLEVGGLAAREVAFVAEGGPDDGPVLVQHRAHGEIHRGWLRRRPGSFEIEYDRPVSAVAPGQSAALYSIDDPDELLGGGVIEATLPVAAHA